jgi:hypothetical protein
MEILGVKRIKGTVPHGRIDRVEPEFLLKPGCGS